MLDRFRRHLEKTGLIPPDARILVGYSGGADSTCLLHLLHEAGFSVVAGHLHHGQRSEADDELARCEAFADSMGIPFATGKADVPRMAADLKIGLEEAGRKARYAFFAQAAFRLDCGLVATAHTRDDLVETILLNLSRGCGLAGLAGIPERREQIVRPLLPFSRGETQQYCVERGLWFHNDPANSDLAFSRARIRHRVLPELRSINGGADEAITRLGTLASEEDRFLNGMAAAALEQSEIPLNAELRFLTIDCEVAFRRDQLESLPKVLFRRAIRLAAEALGGALSFDQTRLIGHTPSGSVTAEGGEVVCEWDAEQIGVRLTRPTEPFRYPLTVPGETLSDEFGWQFSVWTDSLTGTASRAALETEIPGACLKGPLYFRTAEAGDTLRPLGFSGTRKVSDLMSEARLTMAARRRIPIVCDLRGPLWIPGVCLDQRAQAQPGDEGLRLRFSALQPTT